MTTLLSTPARTCGATALVLLFAASAACGGKTSEGGPGGSSSGVSSGAVSSGSGGSSGSGSSSGGSSGSSSGSPSGSTSGSSSGTSCIYVDPTTYDTTCNSNSDCMSITAFTVCSPSCFCGGATINIDGAARYNAAIAGIQNLGCPCAAEPFPACSSNHQCIICIGGPHDPPDCLPSTGACVEVSASSFDRSCKADSDCIEVATGALCTGQCLCPTDSISASAQGAYDMAIAPIETGPPPSCNCPSPGYAYCAGGTCAICPPGAFCVSSYPDGG
jgi:hypothetical protein